MWVWVSGREIARQEFPRQESNKGVLSWNPGVPQSIVTVLSLRQKENQSKCSWKGSAYCRIHGAISKHLHVNNTYQVPSHTWKECTQYKQALYNCEKGDILYSRISLIIWDGHIRNRAMCQMYRHCPIAVVQLVIGTETWGLILSSLTTA